MTEEEERLERLGDALFYDLLLPFEREFAARAIDDGVSDEDAEKMAQRMEGSPAGNAFAYFLRQIKHERNVRRMSHKVMAVMAAQGIPEGGMSLGEVCAEYDKLPKGES